MRHKKGQLVGGAINQLIVVSVIAIILFGYVGQIKESKYSEKLFLSRDLPVALLSYTGLPENAQFQYQKNFISTYTLDFSLSRLLVGESNTKGKFTLKYDYAGYGDLVNPKIVSPKNIVFTKDGNTLLLSQQKQGKELLQEKCLPVQATTGNLVLDPGHGGTDTGFVSGALVEKQVVREIARIIALNQPYPNHDVSRDPTRSLKDDEDSSLNERISKAKQEGAALISIHLGNRDEASKVVRAYFNIHSPKNKESRYMACAIVNSFVTELALDSVDIIPVDLRYLDEKDPIQVLQGEVSVYLEISSLHNSDFVSDTQSIAKAVREGLRVYKG